MQLFRLQAEMSVYKDHQSRGGKSGKKELPGFMGWLGLEHKMGKEK